MLKRITSLATKVILVVSLLIPAGAAVAEKRTFIRDAEIENTIRAFSVPIFQAAGLDPGSVRVYIVRDSALNAFVAGGQKLFIYTGLLMQSSSAEQVIGVIAHEAGHIAGGHLSQTHDALRNSAAQQILAAVLGAAAAIGTGRGDVGAAVLSTGQQAGVYSFLHYSRTQEYAADAAGLRYLDAVGVSSEGIMEFLEKLEDQELVPARMQDPYVRTHPITRERIKLVHDHVAKSQYTGARLPPDVVEMHARMKAKLHAFILPVARTLRQYPEVDTSLAARYARAIAYFRKPDLAKALPLIDSLIAERPEDPYFHELKGEMLFKNGRAAEALDAYDSAIRLMPNSGLTRAALARVQLELNDPALVEPAIQNLRAALLTERDSPGVWRDLAVGYGRLGDKGMSSLALAEAAALRGNARDARLHAERAEKLLPAGSPGALHAADLLNAIEQAEKDR